MRLTLENLSYMGMGKLSDTLILFLHITFGDAYSPIYRGYENWAMSGKFEKHGKKVCQATYLPFPWV